MMKNALNPSILEIVDRVFKSWWTVVAGICLGITGGLVAMHHMPKVYAAQTSILVVPSKIPKEYLKPTTDDADLAARMRVIEEAVLSRSYLTKIIDDHFERPALGEEMEALLEQIRAHVSVTDRKDYFELAFRDTDPERAATVANELAQQFIDENAKQRSARAGNTTETLRRMTEEARLELQAKEQEISDYTARHIFETDEREGTNTRSLDRHHTELERTQAQLISLREQRIQLTDSLQRLIEGATLGTSTGQAAKTPLAKAQEELRALEARYHENHPAVRQKRREVAEAQAAAGVTDESGQAVPTSPEISRLQGELRDVEARIAEAQAKEVTEQRNIDIYRRRLENMPLVEARLAELRNGVDVLEDRYKELDMKLREAQGAQQIEESRQGEQFEVIEAAIAPLTPVSPVPPMVLGSAVIVGLLIFVGPLVLRQLLTPRIVSETGLKQMDHGLPVLVAIPTIDTPEAKKHFRRRRQTNIGLAALCLVAMAITIGFV